MEKGDVKKRAQSQERRLDETAKQELAATRDHNHYKRDHNQANQSDIS